MANNEVQELIKLVDRDRGFILGSRLLGASSKTVKVFEKEWIGQEKSNGGMTKSAFEEVLATGGNNKDDMDFAEGWDILKKQTEGSDFEIKMAGEWYFTFKARKIKKSFRFPYCSTALSACNYIVQHCGK